MRKDRVERRRRGETDLERDTASTKINILPIMDICLLCAERGEGGKNIVDGGHHVELCPPYVLYKIDNIFPNIVCVYIYYHKLI